MTFYFYFYHARPVAGSCKNKTSACPPRHRRRLATESEDEKVYEVSQPHSRDSSSADVTTSIYSARVLRPSASKFVACAPKLLFPFSFGAKKKKKL